MQRLDDAVASIHPDLRAGHESRGITGEVDDGALQALVSNTFLEDRHSDIQKDHPDLQSK